MNHIDDVSQCLAQLGEDRIEAASRSYTIVLTGGFLPFV